MIVSAGIASGHLWLMIFCLLLLMLAFVALLGMLSSVVFGEKPEGVAKGEAGFAMLAPIIILMLLILVLGVTMPTPLSALLDGASSVMNEGIPIVQSTGTGLTADSILGSLGLSQAEEPITLLGVQSGH